MIRRPPRSTLFPTRRSSDLFGECAQRRGHEWTYGRKNNRGIDSFRRHLIGTRSEEHTSELQSQSNLVCRLLLEKKKKKAARYQYSRDRVTKNREISD